MIILVYKAKKRVKSSAKNLIAKLFPDSELPNSVLQSLSTQDSDLHVTGLCSDLHDGNLLTNTEPLPTFHQFLLSYLCLRESPQTHLSLTNNQHWAQNCGLAPGSLSTAYTTMIRI